MADESSRIATSFDGWVLLREPLELQRDGKRFSLQELPLQILELLSSRPGQLVTREELVTHLWPKGVVDFDAGINTAMRKLRVALGDDAAAPRYIETVPRQGYRFLMQPQLDAAPRVPAPPRRRWPAVLAALGVVIALAGAMIALRETSDSSATVARKFRLAVLPFENLSPDPANAFFADGMHEEILGTLANVANLEVISRTTMMQYRGSPKSVADIRKELRITHLLEGTVRREGALVRMTLQLIDARDDRHLWSRSFDSKLTDVMKLQSQVATEIAGQLRSTLLPYVSLPPARSSEAYDLWLQGVLAWQGVGGGGATPQEVQRVEDLYSRAIALDPTYAAAYADRCRVRVARFTTTNRSSEDAAAARADIAMAQKLAGNTPHVLVRSAQLVYFIDGDLPTALELIGEAERIGPLNADFLMTKGNFLAFAGRLEDSLIAHERAADLDPGNPTIFRFWMTNLFSAHRPADALRVVQAFDERFPGRIDRGPLLFEYTGSTARWRQEIETQEIAPSESAALSSLFELLRYEQRTSELKPLLARFAATEFRQHSAYRPASGAGTKPVAELKGWERLMAGDRPAAAREAQLVLDYVGRQQRNPWNASALHLLAAEAALFVADHARAQSETRAALAAMGDTPNFAVGSYTRLMAARVFAWSGADDEAVELLERLSTRHPGIGPAAITRDPLISVPLAKHAGYRRLAEKLEAEIARNQALL